MDANFENIFLVFINAFLLKLLIYDYLNISVNLALHSLKKIGFIYLMKKLCNTQRFFIMGLLLFLTENSSLYPV